MPLKEYLDTRGIASGRDSAMNPYEQYPGPSAPIPRVPRYRPSPTPRFARPPPRQDIADRQHSYLGCRGIARRPHLTTRSLPLVHGSPSPIPRVPRYRPAPTPRFARPPPRQDIAGRQHRYLGCRGIARRPHLTTRSLPLVHGPQADHVAAGQQPRVHRPQTLTPHLRRSCPSPTPLRQAPTRHDIAGRQHRYLGCRGIARRDHDSGKTHMDTREEVGADAPGRDSRGSFFI